MFKVTYEFFKQKNDAKKSCTSIQKVVPSATIEQDTNGDWMVVLGTFNDKEEDKAHKLINKCIAQGFWGGIYRQGENK